MEHRSAPIKFLVSLLSVVIPFAVLFLVINWVSNNDSNKKPVPAPVAITCPVLPKDASKYLIQQNDQCRLKKEQQAGNSVPLTMPPATSTVVAYSALMQYASQDRISQILIDSNNSKAWFTVGKKSLAAGVPPETISQLTSLLSQQNTTIRFMPKAGNSGGTRWIFTGLLILLIIGMVVSFFFRKAFKGFNENLDGDSKRKLPAVSSSSIRFEQVAGCDEVVEEVKEFVQFLKNSEQFDKLGAKMPSGILLYGPPGTGKTLLAKAMAGEAGVPFFAVSGSEFIEKYVGVGASRVRDLFQNARKSPRGAIIFIDEIDAIARRRGEEAHPERDQALNELLTQMDGFHTTSRVVVVAATNRLDVIDPALLRPGRFSRQVQVGLPDQIGRLAILHVYADGKPLATDVDLSALSESTAGCSGADLSDMLNEAAIMAAREGCDEIKNHHLSEGQLRALAGPVRSSRMSEKELETVAFHESGHVLCAELCEEHDKAQRASIQPRGQAGGLALYGSKDRALHSARYLHERLVCALGGRAAEWVHYGVVSSGAANDLQQANALARQAVQELGFSQRTGQVIISNGGQPMHIADATRKVVDEEVERMVAEAYSEAVRLLQEHKEALSRLATALLEAKELDRLEIIQAVKGSGESPLVSTREPQGMTPRIVPVLYQPEVPQAENSPAGVRSAFARIRHTLNRKPTSQP